MSISQMLVSHPDLNASGCGLLIRSLSLSSSFLAAVSNRRFRDSQSDINHVLVFVGSERRQLHWYRCIAEEHTWSGRAQPLISCHMVKAALSSSTSISFLRPFTSIHPEWNNYQNSEFRCSPALELLHNVMALLKRILQFFLSNGCRQTRTMYKFEVLFSCDFVVELLLWWSQMWRA